VERWLLLSHSFLPSLSYNIVCTGTVTVKFKRREEEKRGEEEREERRGEERRGEERGIVRINRHIIFRTSLRTDYNQPIV